MRIGLLTAHDPTDRRAWSGTIYYLASTLTKHCGEIVSLGPVLTGREKYLRVCNRISRAVFRKGYDQLHSLYLSAGYAKAFDKKLTENPVEVIFAPAASTEIALLRTRIPIVYLSDTTFAAISEYYPEFSNLLPLSRMEANFVESRAIRKANRIIYSSQWAKDSAINNYKADRKKIHVIPFGANIDDPPPLSLLMRKRPENLRLLFVGVNWHRKGGAIAVEALLELARLGVPASLTVVGCEPPDSIQYPNLQVIPFLDKNDPLQRKQLFEIYLNSDAFLLPTRAESAGIVFCEAAAFALPVFTTSTGGVSSFVKDGVTGLLFSTDAMGRDYADAIAALWRDSSRFAAMSAASRRAFETRLNWDAWGQSAAQIIHDSYNEHRKSN